MKLINIGLEIRNSEETFRLGKNELAKLKSTLSQMVKNMTKDEIILFNCKWGMLHVAEYGHSIFKSTGERIGVHKNGQPANGEIWKLKMTDSDESVYIWNTFTNEYLFATENKHPESPSSKMISMALTPRGSEFEWIFEYRDEGFVIRNSRNAQYLDSGYPEENNYYVHTRPAAYIWNTYKC